MSDKEVVLKGSFDASGVKQGVQEAQAEVGKLGATAAKAGADAGRGLDQIGKGAEGAGEKVDRETRRMAQAIQRATAAAESGGRATSGYFEAIAAQRGVNVEALRPYIEQLRRAEQAQEVARRGLDGMGLTARETAAALRTVPAQFTDIATSLASGQSPLTVLLQQGGQLKDQFGGVGAAAQALGGYVASLITPFSAAGVAAVALAAGFLKGRQEASGYAEALINSGNAAGVTADQLADMARAIDGATGTQAKAADVLTRLAASGEVGAANLERYARAAIELERAGGPAAEKTADAFADLGRKPLEAVLKLNEAQRFLTVAQFEQIRALQETGRETEAARLAQETYAAVIEQRTPQLVDRLGFLERAWLGIKKATAEAGDALLNIGRSDTLQQQIDELQAARDALLTPGGGFGGTDAAVGRELEIIDRRLDALRETQRLGERAAQAAGERTRQEEAGIKWLQAGERFLTDRQRLEREIAQIRALGIAAGRSELEIEARIAAVRERAAKPERAAPMSEAQRYLENLQRQLVGIQELSAAERTLAEIQSGRLGKVSPSQQAALLAAAQQIDAAKAEAAASERSAKAIAENTKAREQFVQGLDRQIEGGQRTIEQLQDELVGLTQGKEALRQRIELRQEEQAAALELQAIRLEDRDIDSVEAQRLRERAKLIREEIALRRGLATAADNAEAQQAAERSAQKLADEYQRATAQIEQSLTDAIMRGGKSAGELLQDYFRTLVLRPMILGFVRMVGGAVGLGGSGLAQAGQASNALNSLSLAGAAGGLQNAWGGYMGAWGNAGTAASSMFSTGGAATNAALIESAAGTAGYGASSASTGAAWGAGAQAVGGALVGVYGGRAISGGYSLTGGSGNSLVNAGTAAGAAIGTLFYGQTALGAAIGGLIGGALNRAFGRAEAEVTGGGVTGMLSADGFTGSQFTDWRQRGGWFRSDRTGTEFSQVPAELADVLRTGTQAANAEVRRYAEILGLPVETLQGYSQAMRLELRGLTPQQASEAVAQAVQRFQEGLAERFTGQVEAFRRGAETINDTLRRLTGLELFAREINDLGGIFRQVARLGFDARESIIAMAGGLESFQGLATNFVQNFYSREEIAGIRARDVQTQLLELGVPTGVNSREDFRRVVEGTDVSTEAGQQRLVQLLQLAGPFAEVAAYLEETGLTLLEAARQAPAAGVLTPALEAAGREQIDAINAGTEATGRVVERLDQLIELQRELRSRLFVPATPEVGIA